jgi:hypothetical protein
MRRTVAKKLRKKAYENVKANPKGVLGDEYKRLKKEYKSIRGQI